MICQKSTNTTNQDHGDSSIKAVQARQSTSSTAPQCLFGSNARPALPLAMFQACKVDALVHFYMDGFFSGGGQSTSIVWNNLEAFSK